MATVRTILGALKDGARIGEDEVKIRHKGTKHIDAAHQFPPAVNGKRTLEEDTGYIINGTVDVDDTLVFSQGSGIYGINWPQDQINYTGTGTLFEATNVDVMMRNFVTLCPSGTLYDVEGTQDDRFLVQSCAHLMSDNLGTVDGFKVPGFKLTDITNFNEGITFTGNPEKIYLTTCPFREASNTYAIDFDANFTTDYVQIDNSFFKQFNNNSDAIRLDGSATVSKFGIVKGCMFDDTVQNRTVGFDKTTPGWVFIGNSGIQDSSIRGQYNLDSPTETTISSQASSVTDEAAYEKIAGSTTAINLLERVTHSNNELTYTGNRTSTVELVSSASADNVNDTVVFAFFKNGSLVNGSSIRSTLQGATTVNVGFLGEVELETNDIIDARVANLSGTSNPRITDLQVKLRE